MAVKYADDPTQDPANVTGDTASPWLTGDATNAVTDPVAQVQSPANPWSPTQPSAPVQMPTTPAPTSSAGPAGSAPYTQDLGQTGAAAAGSAQAGVTPWTPPAGGTPQSSSVDYSSLMQAVSYATTPQGKAVAQDALARALQGDLEGDGHTVKWQGDTLMIDGRPYEVIGSGLNPGTAPAGGLPLASPAGGVGASTQPIQATSLPASYASPPIDPSVASLADAYVQSQGLQFNQSDPSSLVALAQYLRTQGVNAQVDATDSNGHTGGLLIDGHPYQAIDGSNNYTGLKPWPTSDSGGGPSLGGMQFSPSALASGDLSSLPEWLKNPTADSDLMSLAGQIPGYDQIYSQLAATSPEEQATSDLVTSILQHPESLSDTDVARMKAKNAEDAAAASQSQDEDLQHFGASAGLDTSPWLAAARGANAWDRRNATISSNATVDASAAQTRQADRLAAANLGQGFAQYQTTKAQQAINTAVEAVGAKGNIEQAAKQLGMTKNQLLVSYIGQNLNYDINLKALNEKSNEFIQTLAQRIAEMKQNDDQFQANFGLSLKVFQENKDQDAWLRAQSTFTPTSTSTGA